MKIDLHLHTKKIFSGEHENRNINPINFKKILNDEKVKIASITNHNYFNKSEFKEFQDDNFLLLPGMEINIEDNFKNSYSQINIVLSDSIENIDLLEQISNDISKNEINKSNNEREKYIMKIKYFKDIFKDKEIIILFDWKGGNRNASEKLIEEIENGMNKAIILRDSNNARMHRLLSARNIDSLIGSDVIDWNNYDKYAKKLLSTTWKIKSFNIFYAILKNKNGLKSLISSANSNTQIPIMIENNKFNININNELNLIIGDKATGKSKILKAIENYNNNKKIKTSSFYASEKRENFKKIINSSYILDDNEEISQNLKRKINKISSIKQDLPISPVQIKYIVEQETNSSINIHNVKTENYNDVDYDNIRGMIESILDSFEKISDFQEKEKIISNNLIEKFHYYSRKIINESIKSFVLKNKKNISKKMLKNVISMIKDAISDSKQLYSQNFELGLFNKFKWIRKIDKLRNDILNLKLKKIKNNFMSYEMPGRGVVSLIDKNQIIDFKSKINKEKNTNHQVGIWNTKVFPFFSAKNLNETNINDFKEYFTIKENIDKGFIFAKRYLEHNGNEIGLSDGEESLFMIMYALNKKAEYYILDEPSNNLGSNTVMETLNNEILRLRGENKKIIIASHNPNLGINSLPNNFIFREKNGNEYITYHANIASNYFENSILNKKIEFNKVVMNMLEGGEKNYSNRKEIYDSKI